MPRLGGSIFASADKEFRGLGVLAQEDKVTLYFFSPKSPNKVSSCVSENGIDFEYSDSPFILLDEEKKEINPKNLIKFRIVPTPEGYLLDYQVKKGNKIEYKIATSKYMGTWETEPNYSGSQNIVSSPNFEIHFVAKIDNGILVIFERDGHIRAMCLEKDTPDFILWETNNAIWEKPAFLNEKNYYCIGCISFKGRLLSYWNVSGVGIFLIAHPVFQNEPAHENHHFALNKHFSNPILSPHPQNDWESEATFNAAAIYEDGKVYLVYRAVGRDYISVLGLAESADGVHFERKHDYPIYVGTKQFDSLHKKSTPQSALRFMSGGGYGGVEDPRLTRLGDRIFMVYVAFNGYEPPRLALTSILYENFAKGEYLWEKPVIISPPGVIDKSGCILPEKINGKYVIFHRIYPDILIDFVDDLKFDGTTYLKGEFKISPRPNMWDSRKVGVGAPPIKTDDGWLLIYQAVNDLDDSKYKVGAMLLDLNDPTTVTHRTNHPILEPTEDYENGLAKFGVIYPCGAVVINDELFVYYGGSDSVTCAAHANLSEFIKELKGNGDPSLININLNI